MDEPREDAPRTEPRTDERVGLRIVLTQQDGPNPPWLMAALRDAIRAHFLPKPKKAESAASKKYEPAPQLADAEARALGRIDQIAAGNPDRIAERQTNPPTAEQESAEKAETQRRLDETFARLREKGFRISGQPAGVAKPV